MAIEAGADLQYTRSVVNILSIKTSFVLRGEVEMLVRTILAEAEQPAQAPQAWASSQLGASYFHHRLLRWPRRRAVRRETCAIQAATVAAEDRSPSIGQQSLKRYCLLSRPQYDTEEHARMTIYRP